jgi:hypothetical protein
MATVKSATEMPFMIVRGGAVEIWSASGMQMLAEDWTGLCTETDIKTFWYIGRCESERSFSRLRATTLAEAAEEARPIIDFEATKPLDCDWLEHTMEEMVGEIF